MGCKSTNTTQGTLTTTAYLYYLYLYILLLFTLTIHNFSSKEMKTSQLYWCQDVERLTIKTKEDRKKTAYTALEALALSRPFYSLNEFFFIGLENCIFIVSRTLVPKMFLWHYTYLDDNVMKIFWLCFYLIKCIQRS